MYRNEKKKLTVLFIIMMALVCGQLAAKAAKNISTWKESFTGTIIDADPLTDQNKAGMFYEMDGHFVWIWSDDMKSRWPTRGETGTFYKMNVNGDTKYKWVKTKTASVKKTSSKKTSTINVVNRASQTWSSVVSGLPPIDKTVLVKYKNGKTITTAYINTKKQWKLETDRDRISNGREIKTIAKWRDIQD